MSRLMWGRLGLASSVRELLMAVSHSNGIRVTTATLHSMTSGNLNATYVPE
jgi:hypothetical protein